MNPSPGPSPPAVERGASLNHRAVSSPLSIAGGEGPGEGFRSIVEPRIKLWLERDGRIVMSDYRLRLLVLVAETGSLAEAAQQLGLSYRRAWGKVKELERNLDLPLVQSAAGGAGGGHSEITPEGRELLRRYAAFRARAEQAVREAYTATFGDSTEAAAPIESLEDQV